MSAPQQPTVLFVHAHPDDESIITGGTMAALAAAGSRVVLVTATRGEGGEVIGEDLAHLEGDRAGLASHREQELAEALRVLGVKEHCYLGQPLRAAAAPDAGDRSGIRYEDSGMVWGPDGHAAIPDELPASALCAGSIEDESGLLTELIAEVRPDAVVTYAQGGGYGHPDHVRCHDMTVDAVASVPEGHRPLLFFAETPAEEVARAFDPTQPGFTLTGFDSAQSIPTVPATRPVAVAQDVSGFLGAKAMAMAAHATQITVAGQFFALSNGVGQAIPETEYFTTDAALPNAHYADLAQAIEAVRRSSASPDSGTAVAGAAGAAGPGTGKDGGEHGAFDPASEAHEKTRKVGMGAWIHALLIGFLLCMLGTFQHLNASVVDLGGQLIIAPWGLALAILMTTAGLWHVASMYRSTVLMVFTGAVVSMGAFALGQTQLLPGADLLVVNNYRSVIWLFAPMIIAGVLAFTVPSLRAEGRSSS